MCDTNCSQEELIRKVDQLGTEMGEFCTKAFLPPNDLEYEKFYYPILLKGKKRYAGHKFEPGLAPKLDVKGFECVRRDFAPIVSLTQKRVLVKLCKERDVEGAIQLAREVVLQLLHNNVPLEHLIMSKQLTRRPQDYKNPAPHTHLAQRLQATQPAHIAPKTGDRIDYLIRPGFKGEKTYLRSVSPEDVREGRASVDTRWYLSNQLQKPLQRIFEMLMDNSSDIFRVDSVSQTHAMSNDVMRGFVQRTTTDTRTRSAVRIHQRPRKKQKTKTMDIRAFFK
jgi:DNA polymerase delta subunit 1